MPSRRRKRSSPQRLEGENAIKRKEFAFVVPRSSALQPVDENSEVSFNIPAFQQTSSDSRELNSPTQPIDPVVSIPIYSHSPSSMFQGIPITKFSVRFEQRCDLGDFLSVSNGAAKFSLLWDASGRQLVKIEVGVDTIFIPTKIEPDLSYDAACKMHALVHTKQRKLARLFFSADRKDGENVSSDCCFRGIELWASDLLCEYDNSSVVPRKSISVDRCKALMEVLYPGLCITHMEGGLVSPSKHQLSIVAKIRQFYIDVQRRRHEDLGGASDPELDPSPLLPHLTAVLRGYQGRAVAWMMQREGVIVKGGEEVEGGGRDPLHLLWMKIPSSATGLECPVYFNQYTGQFSDRRFPPAPWPKGGILADEMGLGKTVEILALILAHKWPGEDQNGNRAVHDLSKNKSGGTEEDTPVSLEQEYETSTAVHGDCCGSMPVATPLHDEGSLIVSISCKDSPGGKEAMCTDQSPNSDRSPQGIPQTVRLSLTDGVIPSRQRDIGLEKTDSSMNVQGEYTEQKTEYTEQEAEYTEKEAETNIQAILDEVARRSGGCNHLTSANEPTTFTPADNQVRYRSAEVPDSLPSSLLGSQSGISLSGSSQLLNDSFCYSLDNSLDNDDEGRNSTLRSDFPTIQDVIRSEHSYSNLHKEVADSEKQSAGEDECGTVPNKPSASQNGSNKSSPVPAETGGKGNSSPSKQPPVCSQSPSKIYQSPVKGRGSSGSQEVVKCLCGAKSEGNYNGEFVQCERCLVWQHSKCADFHASRHDTFVCIKCLLEKPLPSGATLIISPTCIAQQWEEEICKHTQPGALKVLQYRGVSQMYVSPFELVSYDIVLVAYETLRTEVDHANSHEVSRVLRHQKRHTCPPSPLPAVKWWRICLDEAQMVESTHTKAAEMTQKLSGVNHWCVTGTPVMKDLTDLYGLVAFLGADPYSQFFWFNRLVWYPFMLGREGPMISLFSKLMWRNSKADVADELQLPDQMEEIHWLNFSAVEAYFYRRQQQTCTSDLAKVLAYLPESNLTLSSLLQSTVQKLMTPLHRLRQACCHPQIVRGGYLPINISSKNCLTMPELLDKLIMQAKVEAREALRQLVAALNGLAGVSILKEEWGCAVEYYREAMLVWQEHEKDNIDCDKLQRIHTMENLSQLLREGRGGNSHTLRDDHLIEDAKVLRDKYSEKPEAQVRAAVEGLVACKQAIVSAKLEANWAQAEYLGELPMDEGCGDYQGELAGDEGCGEYQGELAVDEGCGDYQGELAGDKGCGEYLGELAVDKGCGEYLGELAGDEGCGEYLGELAVDKGCGEYLGELAGDEGCGEYLGELAGNEGYRNSSVCAPQANAAQSPEQISGGPESEPASGSASGDGSSEVCQSHDSTCSDSTASMDTMQPAVNVGSNSTVSVDAVQPAENIGSQMSSSEPSVDTPATNQPRRKPRRKPVTPSCPWWLSLLQWVEQSVHTQELLETVNTELSNDHNNFPNFRMNFRYVEGMQLLLCSHMDKIEGCRGRLLEALDKLSASPSEDLVAEVGACHLRPDGSMQSDEMCQLCVTEEISIEHERLLFARYHTAEEGHMRSEHGDGSRALSLFERILRCLLSFVKHKRAPALLLASAQAFLAYLEALKKEYKAMRALWLAADQRLCACDELQMASSRLRLMTPYEILLGFDVPSTINPFEVDFIVAQFNTDKLASQHSLKKCVGQVLYLKNLTKTQGESAQVCPVCTRHLGGEWGVFTCGHPLCMECIFTMVNMRRCHMYTSWGYREEVPIKCPLCRVPSLSTEINYVRTGSGEDKQLPIKGSHSTKIIGITRTLINIQQQEPGAKALVFSSWLDILELIARAMRENDIKFSFLKTRSTFQENLATFKTSPDVNVLLLPVHSGSKGLNIVEATHVLLVEPSLNIGVELQAIGRVHRMGQTKPTTVHRFYVKDSVEERIYNLLNSQADKTKFLISNERESTLTVAEIQHLLQD